MDIAPNSVHNGQTGPKSGPTLVEASSSSGHRICQVPPLVLWIRRKVAAATGSPQPACSPKAAAPRVAAADRVATCLAAIAAHWVARGDRRLPQARRRRRPWGRRSPWVRRKRWGRHSPWAAPEAPQSIVPPEAIRRPGFPTVAHARREVASGDGRRHGRGPRSGSHGLRPQGCREAAPQLPFREPLLGPGPRQRLVL